MAKKSGHPLGVTGRMLFGAAITTVGMGLSAGVAVADPQQADTTQATEDARPAPPVDVRTMTDQELGTELGRVAGKDSLREQEVVTEMKARGAQFWEAAPAPDGIGVSGAVPVRPGVSVTGTIAYDSYTGSWYVSGGVRAGKPSGPQFTGIAPKPDGLNANGTVKLDIGKHGEFSSTLSLNLSPEGEVTGGYKAKGTVTTPEGRSYETEVTVERKADGTVSVELPDGYTTSTPLPGGGTVDTTTPADPTEERKQPEIKGPAPRTEEQQPSGSWSDWFDWSGGVSIDKEIRPAPQPPPTTEEIEAAKESWAEQQRTAKEQQDAWRAQNRPEAQYREGLERAQEQADAAEAARRAALPDRDHDGVPDEEDATWNQNDTDPSSSDQGDGPEGGAGYPSDRVESPAPTSPPDSDDPDADYDQDGIPDRQDATWNQNDTDPSSSDQGDGPESGAGYDGTTPDQGSFSGDLDGDGLTGSADATPNQNDADPSSTDLGDGPEGGEGYGDVDGTSNQNDLGSSGTDLGDASEGGHGGADADGDGLTGSADATPNQNDTDPSSTDQGDGPEGGEGYGGSGDSSGYGDAGSDAGSGSGSDSAAGSGGYSDTGTDSSGYSGSDTGSDTSGFSGADAGTDTGGYSGSDTGTGSGSDAGTDSGGYGADADGDGLSGSDSTPNQNDTDPSSTDVGDGPEGNAGYSGSTDSGGYGTESGDGSCACV
ncbi:hypothetical protein [Actinophytocola glycyrrhizae]|uniref:Uncharacterized protein n=1 Tax=Actinophytocola glycyrrhizae TaxID=2044873 RepID=A0ABV9RUK2_9PSEU